MADSTNKRVLLVSSAIGIVLVAMAVQQLIRDDSSDSTQDNQKIEEWDVVVVGSGSAGLSAAVHAAEEAPFARILLLEKAATVGGNSAKASSGMNALDDVTDVKAVRAFVDDVKRSGGGLSDDGLVDVLVRESGMAVEFLRKIGVPFSSHLVQLGGHSEARTHTVTTGAVGWTIVSQLKAAVEALENVHIRTQSSVEKLIVADGEESDESSPMVRGCLYKTQDGKRVVAYATRGVILATGGFGHNFQWLSKYVTMSPITTTNGNFSTGDGIVMGEQIGAKVKYVDQVQIHPTSFIDPLAPDAETKILAPEKLRGLGGILVSQQGTRFVNELDTRDKVTKAILSLPEKSAYLILDKHIEDKVGSAMKFYKGKKLIQEFPGGLSELEKTLGMPQNNLVKTVTDLNAIASTQENIDPSCIWRPKIHKFDVHGKFLFAKITPSVHYTMGGLAIDTSAHVLDSSNKPIKHLYAAGEVTGGVHGRNRLGGNSLLDCIVFGSIAGRAAVSSTLP